MNSIKRKSSHRRSKRVFNFRKYDEVIGGIKKTEKMMQDILEKKNSCLNRKIFDFSKLSLKNRYIILWTSVIVFLFGIIGVWILTFKGNISYSVSAQKSEAQWSKIKKDFSEIGKKAESFSFSNQNVNQNINHSLNQIDKMKEKVLQKIEK